MSVAAPTAVVPRVEASSPALPWQAWIALASVSSILTGAYWDISWHMTIGRDTFWTPAHLAIQFGGILAAVSGAWQIFSTTFGRDAARRERSIRVWGFRGPLGAFVAAWGGVTMAASAPFDNWWHNAYGLDVKILSPPHAVLDLGLLGVAVGGLLLVLSTMNQRSSEPSSWIFLLIGAESLVLLLIAIWEETYRVLLHRANAYAAIAIVVPFFLVWMARASRHRWGATVIAALYSVLCIAGVVVMPLFSAEPKLGPVYQPVTHFVPLEFPLLIVFPALAMDLLRPRLEKLSSWIQAAVLGALFLAVLLAVQWPFANFLVSPASHDRFFGTGYFPYFERPTTYAFRGALIPPEEAGKFALRMGEALLAAVLGTRLGMFLGDVLRRVRR